MVARRSSIAPTWLVYVMSAVVLVALYAAYPRGGLRSRLLASETPSDVSVAYLEAWLRVAPDDTDLLTILGSQYVRLGRTADALRLADRMAALGDTGLRKTALLLRLGVNTRAAFALKENDPNREKMLALAREQLAQSAMLDWSIADLKMLADDALAVNSQQIAAQFYARLAVQDTANQVHWNEQVARFAIYAGDYRAAANAWFRLQAQAHGIDDQRRFFIAGLRALQSGNLLDDALAAADQHAGALIHDRATLLVLLNLARAAHRPDSVDRYAKAIAGYAQATPDDRDDSSHASAVLTHYVVPAPPRMHALDARVVVSSHRMKYLASRFWNPASFTFMDGATPVAGDSRAVRSAAYRVGGQNAADDDGVRLVRVADTGTTTANVSPPLPARASQTARTSGASSTAASAVTAAVPPIPASSSTAAIANSTDASVANNDDVKALLYQSFLESNDLASAQRLATEEVARNPGSATWAKRLAQVAEWNKAPPLALKMWLTYAQLSQDPAGWQNVLRIAPMLNDDNAYLAALIQKSNGNPSDLKLVDAVTATFERLGRPDDAIAFLKNRDKGAEAADIELRIGTLAERAGHDDEALDYYLRLHQAHPDNTLYALRAASMLFRHDHQADALNILMAARSTAKPDDVEFWRNVAQLARLLQRDDIANDAYRHLLASGQEAPEDLAAMTFFYNTYPIDAARTAEAEYQRDHAPLALQQAIHYYTDARANDRVEALLKGMPPALLATEENDPAFLRVRAEYYRRSEQPAKALQDLQRAVRMPGAPIDLLGAYLWALVDYGSDQQIRAALAPWAGGGDAPPALWGPLAAANMRLNQPEAALRFLRLQAASMSRDPLWLLVYADALEMAGHVDLAWSVRRDVWRQMQQDDLAIDQHTARGEEVQRARAVQDEDVREDTAGRRVGLASTYVDADRSKALLIDLLQSDGGRRDLSTARRTLLGNAEGLSPVQTPAEAKPAATGPQERLTSAVAKDVALAWALSHEGDPMAKRWLAQQYISTLTQPAEQLMAIALADDDKAAMKKLLDQKQSRLTLNARIDASVAVDRRGVAEQMAFQGLAAAPGSDVLHERLLDTAMNWPQSVGTSVNSESIQPLSAIQHSINGSVRIGEHYMVGVNADQRFQHSTDSAQLTNVPSVDRNVNVYVRRQSDSSAFQVTAGRREALDSFYTLNVAGELNRNKAVSVTLSAGINQEAAESQTLLVGGVKDNVIASATWQATPRLYASGTVEADRFFGQDRTYLGGGTVETGELGYRVRTDYPDYTVRVVGVRGDYHASGQPAGLMSRLIPADNGQVTGATVMPQSYTQYGAFVGFGNQQREQYSRAWRPFLDVGVVHDSLQGWGPQVNVGIAGSVFGGDRAVLFYSRQQVSGVGTAVTLMGVQYIYFY